MVAARPRHGCRLHPADRAPRQMRRQIDEVAAFADQAPAAHFRVLGPVGLLDLPGVDEDRDLDGSGTAAQLAHELLGKGLSLIHISEPTRRTPISYAVFCL